MASYGTRTNGIYDSELMAVDQNAISSWICPEWHEGSDKILGWVNKTVSEYQKTLTNSINYNRLQRAIKALAQGDIESEIEGKKDSRRSKLKFNRTKRQMTKLVAILSDIKPAWDYVTQDLELEDQAGILTKLHTAYWNHPDTQVRKALIGLFQYVLTGEGYLRVSWENDPFRQKDFGLKLEPFSIDDIAFSQLPKDKDIQKAYCTVIRHELPIATACMLYPAHAKYFMPNNESPTWFAKIKSAAKSMYEGASSALEISQAESQLGYKGFPHSQTPLTSESTIDIYEVYILDFSVNTTGKLLKLGREGTSEYYEIPSLGARHIPTSLNDPATGLPIMREPTAQEALLYPQRRRIICTPSHLISDGPSPWAHAQTPLVRFSLNDWVWDRVGDAVAMDGHMLNTTIESLYKGFHDMLERRVNPGMKLPNTWSAATIKAYDPREPGRNVKVDPLTNTSVEPIIPQQFNLLNQSDLAFIETLKQECDYITGEPEVRALAQAQQVPSAETFEKFLQMAGPLTKFVALNIEASLMEVGEMAKALYFQYATVPRRFKVLAAAGMAKQDFDYEPGTLVPKEYPGSIFPSTTNARIRQHLRRFSFTITPGSAYQLVDVQRQMMILQLWRDPKNYPISPWLVAQTFNLNIGEPPPELNNEFKRWEYWQKLNAELGVTIQANSQVIMAQVQLAIQQMAQTAQGQQMLQAILGASGSGDAGHLGALHALMSEGESGASVPAASDLLSSGGGLGSPQNRPGQPPSGHQAPQLVQKSDGRLTVSESGKGGGS